MNRTEKMIRKIVKEEVTKVVRREMTSLKNEIISEVRRNLKYSLKENRSTKEEAAKILKYAAELAKRKESAESKKPKNKIWPPHLDESLSKLNIYDSEIPEPSQKSVPPETDEMIEDGLAKAARKAKQMKRYAKDPALNEMLNSVTAPVFDEDSQLVVDGRTGNIKNNKIIGGEGSAQPIPDAVMEAMNKDYSSLLKASEEKTKFRNGG